MIFTISSPLSIPVTKNKGISLNLNVYRNTYYQNLNKAKRNYELFLEPEIEKLPFLVQIDCITYTLYTRTRRRIDISNVCCIVDKFFSDALVMFHKIEDDNCNFIKEIRYKYGGIDKNNPRVEIIIDGVPYEN